MNENTNVAPYPHESPTLAAIAPRLAKAYAAERDRRRALRWHIYCADCQIQWFADGKATVRCPRCGSGHLREGSSMPDGGLLDCGYCGAEYGQPCRRREPGER